MGSYLVRSGTPSFLLRLLANMQETVMQFTSQHYGEPVLIVHKADREMPYPCFPEQVSYIRQ